MKIYIQIICMTVAFTMHLFIAYTQNKTIDSLQKVLHTQKEDSTKVNILLGLSKQFNMQNNYDLAKKYAGNALALAGSLRFGEVQGWAKGEADAYRLTGVICTNQSKYAEAMEYLSAGLKISEKTGYKQGIAKAYASIANVYDDQGNYPGALKNSIASLKIQEEIGDRAGIANSYNSLGIIYMEQRNYPEALKNLITALKIREEEGDKEGMGGSYNNMALAYMYQGNYREALKYNFASLKIAKQTGAKQSIAYSYGNIANVYLNQENYSQALKNYLPALKIFEEIEDKQSITGSLINIGQVYSKQNNFTEALQYLNRGVSLAKEINEKDYLMNGYANLAEASVGMNDYKKAYEYRKLQAEIKDTLLNAENNKHIAQMKEQYESEKKDQRILVLNKDQLFQKQEISKQKIIRNSFIAGFALMLLFAGMFFIQRNHISTARKRSDELLLNILPSDTAEELKATGAAKAKSFDEVTVMFTDFENFTSASERLTAVELVHEINYCYSAFDKIISKYRIEKIKTIGDSYMAAGGLPVANKTNAEDIIMAAIEIQKFMEWYKQEKLKENKPGFEIRIGIHTGPVVAGIVGIKKFAYDIWGDTVNIASRMESSGAPGKVNISGATYEVVKDKFTCIPRGEIEAKNKGMITMYFVEGPQLLN